MSDLNDYERVVLKLIFQHCHSNSKERKEVVAGYLTDGLDFDQAVDLIDKTADSLSFVYTESGYVWYEQNESMLIYVQNETSRNLGIIGKEFSHLTPPSLRGKYNLPPPEY